MILIVFVLSLSEASNINCADSLCSSCVSGYLYNSTSCLPMCPTGYLQTSSPNLCTSSSTFIYSLNFAEFLSFTAHSIGNFAHPSGLQFMDPGRYSPIPTNERGFYFVSTSRLVSTVNYIIGPDFTLRLCIRIKTDGTIFEATSGGISYLKLAGVSGKIVSAWYLTSTTTSSYYSLASYSYSDSWFLVTMLSSQTSGLFTIYTSGYTMTIANFEFRGQVSNLLSYFGGATTGNSFTGFFYHIFADNIVNNYNSIKLPTVLCEYNEYYDISTSLCMSCSGCTTTWPWCTKANCTPCYTTSCSACTGFTYTSCTACSTSIKAPDCVLGQFCTSGSSLFNCTTCSPGYTLIDNLCLISPYLYNPLSLNTPALDLSFNTFEQYYEGIMQSGINASTWGPFNDSETDDPIPVKNRGLYFDGVARYLVSNTGLTLNYKFSVAIWINTNSGNYYFDKNTFVLYYLNYAQIYLSNPYTGLNFYTNTVSRQYNWYFVTYSVNFMSATTSIVISQNLYSSTVLSTNGYAFYDTENLLFIGKSSSGESYFNGYLYTVKIWQTAITDFSSAYNTCGTGLGATCLWNCNIGNYYNYYEANCDVCQSSCTTGCSTWGTCNKCLSTTCATCDNFNNTCTQTIVSPCKSSYYLSTTLNCCSSSCKDCYGPSLFNCKACFSPKYLIAQACVTSCPIGYTISSSSCIASISPFITLNLNVIQDTLTDSSSGIQFGTGKDTSFYPTGTSSDPIPAVQRGYYFTPTSYLSSQSIILPYNFTMVFYLKHLSPGQFLSKGKLSITTSPLFNVSIASVINATFPLIPITDWIVLAINLWTKMTGTTTVSLAYPPAASTSQFVYGKIFLDSSGSLVLGASSGSFTGFIYQFLMYIYPQSVSTLTANMCSNSSQTGCLWNCDITHYLSGSSCIACEESCLNGCRRGTDCDLCQDLLCLYCSGYETCTECKANAVLVSNVCECDQYYSMDSSNECSECPTGMYSSPGGSCVDCDTSCLECSGPASTDCTFCFSEASLQGNTSCICNPGYFGDPASCTVCDPTCLTCNGPLSTNCTSCFANAQLDLENSCQCANFYFWDGTGCSACYAECANCTGASSTSCTGCYANAALQGGGSCLCNLGFYWGGLACQACDATCLACTGGLSDQCTECTDNAVLQTNYTCSCSASYVWTGSECEACYLTCEDCLGTAANQCVDCVSGLTLQVDNSCTCGLYFYLDLETAMCNDCDNTCAGCSGPGSYSCVTCKDNASLIAGLCICNDGWYWDGGDCRACDKSCLRCNGPAAQDCICGENFTKINEVCTCNEGYFVQDTICQSCDQSCLTCFGPYYYHCTSCSNILLEIVCVNSCPVGFLEASGNCTMIVTDMPTVKFVFDTLDGVFVDGINGIEALTGDSVSYYPILDTSDPIPAYQRGIYFTGTGSYLSLPYHNPDLLLFGIRFSISTWINPSSPDGALFYKSHNSMLIFSAVLADLYLNCSVLIDNKQYSFESIYPISTDQWNHLLISIHYVNLTSILLYVNELCTVSTVATEAPFVDAVGTMYVGTTSSFSRYFQGFIYSIAIFYLNPSLDSLAISTCDQCNICPVSGICLPICNLTSYSSDSLDNCILCSQNCYTGCRNSQNCSLCYDVNCLACSNYDQFSCTMCMENYVVKNSKCVECSETEFYNNDTKTCCECEGLCQSCLSPTLCLNCRENSSLDSNGMCICNQGYSLNITCIRNVFTALITINSTNYVTIIFTEPLSTKLNVADVSITINSNSIQAYDVDYIDNYSYLIVVNYTQDINTGDKLQLEFNHQLLSQNNSILNVTHLAISLFASTYSNISATIAQLRTYSQAGVAAGASVAFSVSIININPSTFFHFLNNAEMYYYASLYAVDVDPGLVAFLDELRVVSRIPNIYSYVIDRRNGANLDGKVKNYWYDTNLILLNSGVNLTIMTILFMIVCIINGFKMINNAWIKEKSENLLDYFRYSVFLRLWIQSYMEILLNSLIGMIYSNLENITQLVDFCICFFLLVNYT